MQVRRPIARVRTGVGRRLREYRKRRMLLTVVMPVYNVEGYLDEAVRSVLTQSHRNLELILVDDGSSDTSGALCDEFARGDSRVRVIHKRNAGLGAARNTGIRAARGAYLTFIDSDDYVLPGAYSGMISSLERSGSDLATGNVQRKQGMRTYQAWNQSRSHRKDQQGTSLEKCPDLVFDTVAWNKVFRRSFWNDNVGTFPEGKLYEDMLPIFTAFATAKSVDILARVVYVWRFRDEGNSITQRLLEPKNIDDRFEMLDAIDSMIVERAMPETLRDLLRDKVLEGDLWIYVREMRGAPPEVVDRIRQGVARYWVPASAARKASALPERRIAYWLLEQARAADVEPLRGWYSSVHSAPPINAVGGRLMLDPTDCPVSLAGIPDSYLDLDAVAHTTSNVMGLQWISASVLRAHGYAYTRFISDGQQDIRLIATHPRSGEQLTFRVERTDSPDAARWAWDTASDHLHDGYVCDIDVAALRDAAAFLDGQSEWRFEICVADGDVVRTTELTRIWRSGSAGIAPSSVLPDGTVAIAQTTDGQPLRIRFDRNGVLSESVEVHGSSLQVSVPGNIKPAAVWAVESRTRREVNGRRGPDGAVVFDLPAPSGNASSSWWTFNVEVDGRQTKVFAPRGFANEPDPTDVGMRAWVSRSGLLAARYDLRTAFINDIRVADDAALEISGALSSLGRFELALSAEPVSWHRPDIDGGRFTVRVPITHATGGGQELPFAEGNYSLLARSAGSEASAPAVTLLATGRIVADFPATYLRAPAKIKLSRNDRDGIAVAITPPVPDAELGRRTQAALINRYVAGESRAVEDAVFFCTDLGSTVGDSALAIQQELSRRDTHLRMYWGVTDLSVPVPAGVIPVVKHSRQWYDTLNTSRYLVNNYGGLWGLRKGADQRYLQTWHGTPFKFIGAAELRHKNASDAALRTIAEEASEWDAAVSPSPYMSAVFAEDLLFTGPVLETGYPRNDRLSTATSEDVAELRAELGLPLDAKVLLYAPTYRENQRHGWKAELFDALDLDRLLDLLGPDWCVVLRGHSFNARNDQLDRSHGRLIDATRHPSINDLYLAADALVTDYSSVMFDFAVTAKPMAFFAPDLLQYQAARGVYFELAAAVPGPVHSDVAHLADALSDLPALTARYAERYAAFRERFVPWDDGKAAARVVDTFFV